MRRTLFRWARFQVLSTLMLPLRVRDLGIHATDPILAALPFTVAALPDSASELALREIGRHVRNHGALPYTLEPFE